ncbi:hypothetical protein A5671_07750 [Mycolicibacter heraklionensis]|nr:hypothetical protein A5671_07750 [Mycolicibacter heraklionensis]
METEAPEQQSEQSSHQDELPADHPLVKSLAATRAELKELRGKAKRLDALEEAQKSEAEKVADRIAKAEAEAASVPSRVADSLRSHLVALHGISTDDAELFLTSADPDILLKQVARLTDQRSKRERANHVPREGTNPPAPEDDMRQFTRQLFKADQ